MKCDYCNKCDLEEVYSLTEYGDRAYGVDTDNRDFCKECFQNFIGEYDEISTNSDTNMFTSLCN